MTWLRLFSILVRALIQGAESRPALRGNGQYLRYVEGASGRSKYPAEVKVGDSPYEVSQQLKDFFIQSIYGTR